MVIILLVCACFFLLKSFLIGVFCSVVEIKIATFMVVVTGAYFVWRLYALHREQRKS